MFVFWARLVAPLDGLVDVTDGAESVVNCHEMSGPGLSGGSLVSLVLRTLVCAPEPAQLMEMPLMFTLSLHVMLMFALVATPVAVSLGEVETICGFASVENEKL